MESKKRWQAGAFTAFLVFLGSLLVVTALTNSTDNYFIIGFNESLNITFVANIETLNETITNISIIEYENETAENLTLTNETIKQTIPAENLEQINQSENLTLPIENITIINISLPGKPAKNLTDIVEKHKGKFNNKTEEYLKKVKDKKEEKEFIVKFKSSIDENKLANVTLDRKVDRFKLTKITGKIGDIED